MQSDQQVQTLLLKLQTLPPDKLVEAENFIDFLRVRDDDRRLVTAAARLSEAAFTGNTSPRPVLPEWKVASILAG